MLLLDHVACMHAELKGLSLSTLTDDVYLLNLST